MAKNISLTSYDAQLADAQRRQKMAEMLQEQANAPFDIQSYKGVQSAIPWTAVLAKALQSGAAAYQGRKADEQKAALGEQTRKGLADYLQQSSANYQIPNIQTSPPMRTEQVQGPMAQPVGFQTPQQLTAGGMQGMAARGGTPPALAAALAASGSPPMGATPQTGAMAPPAPIRPQTISVPDMTPQPAMINRSAADRQQMVLQGIASDNPLIRQVAPSMYDQATKDVDKETMVNAIKKIKVEGTDAEMLGAYMASPDPSKALDYLVSVGNSRAEAAAKLDAIKFKIQEDAASEQRRREFSAEQNDLNRQLQLFGINQGSADRRFAAGLSSQDRQIAREDRLSQLTPLQQNELMGIVKSTNAVKTALNAIDTPGAFSAARGAATRMGPLGESLAARNDTPDQRNARAQVFNVMSSIIKERAGTAQSKSELATLNSFLPNAYDTGPIIKDKLKGFERYLADQEKAVTSVGRYGVQQPAGAADPLGLR